MIQVFNAQDIDTPYTRWFLYGESGSGKTKNASSFPRPFFILPRNENSILTLRGLDVPYTLIANRQEMEKTLGWLTEQYLLMLRHFEANNDDAAHEAFPYETIVIENLSHYCELVVEDISRGGEIKMDQQAWGLVSNHLRNIHSTLCNMDVHTVYTSLAAVDEKKGNIPMITGKNALLMPSSCDVIAYCETHKGKKNDVYTMHFRKFAGWPARSRFSNFPESVNNFDFRNFESLISDS